MSRITACLNAQDAVAEITVLLRSGTPPAARVAENLGLSKRTFQRRLTEQGLTYSELVDRARFTLTTELLTDGRMTVNDISRRVGYTDPSNFCRAFSRWTGQSPNRWRKINGGE